MENTKEIVFYSEKERKEIEKAYPNADIEYQYNESDGALLQDESGIATIKLP